MLCTRICDGVHRPGPGLWCAYNARPVSVSTQVCLYVHVHTWRGYTGLGSSPSILPSPSIRPPPLLPSPSGDWKPASLAHLWSLSPATPTARDLPTISHSDPSCSCSELPGGFLGLPTLPGVPSALRARRRGDFHPSGQGILGIHQAPLWAIDRGVQPRAGRRLKAGPQQMPPQQTGPSLGLWLWNPKAFGLPDPGAHCPPSSILAKQPE